MIVLAFDTVSAQPGAALWRDGDLALKISSAGDRAPRASDLMMPFIMNLLEEHAVELDRLDGVAIAAGPGTFTGIRVGLALAKGMLFGTTIPVAPVPTWEILATIDPEALASVQLRKTEWLLRHDGEIRNVDAAGWRDAAQGRRAIILGDPPGESGAMVVRATESFAGLVASLGAETIRRGEGVAIKKVVPLYPRHSYVS